MPTHAFGKYIVTRSLGRGGMAEVYQAHDPVLDRAVAIKVILPHLAAEEGFAARFLREAKLIASLRHAHLVQLIDFDMAGDQLFMVMEYLEGDTLKARLSALPAERKRMALGEIARLIGALAAAIDYAHSRGAIHRDIKPANILFTSQNEPVLSDFGIAKLLDQTGEHSMTGGILGTPAYMSPEQAAGKAAGPASDLYALGIVTYEMITGRVPFWADSPAALLLQHLTEPPPPPRTLNPNLPPAAEEVILQALAKNAADRFTSASEFARAFRSGIAGKPLLVKSSAEDATIVAAPQSQRDAQPPSLSPGPPDRSLQVDVPRAIFVTREAELAKLQAFFDQALAGEGRVCFVSGEAGTGKTALVTEFARRMRQTHPALLVAVGNCNALSGRGDPYLPFREILASLLGLADSSQPADGFLAGGGQALVDSGPDLINAVIPGLALQARLAEYRDSRPNWMERLARLIQHKTQAGQESGVESSHIFEQYTNVLKGLAVERPLLLVLDDLQWVDAASVDLLFHLGRRLDTSQILLVGTYRPDEMTGGSVDQSIPRPLQKVLAELKRSFGEIQIILPVRDESTGRRFVDSLVDSEPNRLGRGFRQALFEHTGGHPLFTVELLRYLQAEGDLTQEVTGEWVAEPTLDWEKLPPRVEGVIEERISRLTEELRGLLTVASVEGEDFTAEVVARVQRVDVRGLIGQLSSELERQHRLVGAVSRQRVGQQRLSLFRFQHNLFQKYLYNRLNPVERAVFHEDVGTVLEELYGGNADVIAVQLAWHFSEADLPDKARHHLVVAGEQARRRYANAEALSYLTRALELTPEGEDSVRYALLLEREKVYDIQGNRPAQQQDLAQLDELARRLGDPQRQAEVALRQTLYADRIGEYRTSALYAQTAIELAAVAYDIEREATGYHQWGRALLNLSDYPESQSMLEKALALADANQLHQVKANCLRTMGVIAYFLGDFAGSSDIYTQALKIYRTIGDRRSEGHILSNLGLSFRERAMYVEARSHFDQAWQLYQEIGDRGGAAHVLVNLGLLSRDQGDFAASRGYYEQALEISEQTSARAAEALALLGIGDVYKEQDLYTNAAAAYEQAFLIFRTIGDRRMEHLALKELAGTALYLGDYETAHTQYETALATFREIGDRQSESSALNRLGLLYHQIGDEEAARDHSQAALTIAQELGDRWLESSSLTKLGHALAGLEQPDVAVDCYQNAVESWRELGRPDLALESVAGLARIALERNEMSQAQSYAEELITQFANKTFSPGGMAEEFLTCYRVLHAIGDQRAPEMLHTIYSQIQTNAANIPDTEIRRVYLENVRENREIVEAWKMLQK